MSLSRAADSVASMYKLPRAVLKVFTQLSGIKQSTVKKKKKQQQKTMNETAKGIDSAQ